MKPVVEFFFRVLVMYVIPITSLIIFLGVEVKMWYIYNQRLIPS